jgi:outer membrane protein TolC
MKNIKSLLLTIVVLALGFDAHAQKVLTIDEAMALALKNNFDISVSKSEAAISATNNTAGAAGMLPSINLTGSGNYALKQTGSKASENEEYTNHRMVLLTLNAGAELS